MTDTEHVDVLIVGAGLSGIGAACHLTDECPQKTYLLLEARDSIGGTWDLFRYPGIRSDSDMFTLGYRFRPWTEPKAIADGPSILKYIKDTAEAYGVTDRIRFGHKVISADWSSDRAQWTVTAQRGSSETVRFTCSLLYVNTGYYSYDSGYSPAFPGMDRFAGQVVHPQQWPEDLDYAGKQVVVIGSGATAVTLVPSLAGKAAHVTMLQRSPTYMISVPSSDPIADVLRKWLPAKAAYPIVRWKNVLVSTLIYRLSQRRPNLIRGMLRRGAVRALPAGYDVDTHFNPSYGPWDQRLCLLPDGDFYAALTTGTASVETDKIETATEHGITLASGKELSADIIVTATGLNLRAAGGMTATVDGVPVHLRDTVSYKGMMLSGLPNLVMTFGYTNNSWTLKADLVAGYTCRLLNHMDARGYDYFTPQPPGPDAELMPFLVDLKSGYVRRGLDELPRQGTAAPWRIHQNYPRDVALLRRGPLSDKGIRFHKRVPARASWSAAHAD